MKSLMKVLWTATLAVGAFSSSGVLAQAPPAATPATPQLYRQDRQQRIQEHQERMRKIMEAGKQRQQAEEQQQQAGSPPAAPGQPVAPGQPGQRPAPGQPVPQGVQPGQALPTGPIQSVRMTPPVQQATPTPAAAPQTARSESRTIMLFHPLDSLVKVGDQFATDLVAETKEGEVDEISVFIRYPRHVLSPLALDHSSLDPFVKDKLDYEFNPDEGTIYLRAKLAKPTRFAQSQIASIVWEALEENEGAVISYEFGKAPYTTGLYLRGTDLLGTLPGAEDGVIRTTVQVVGPVRKPTITELEGKDLMIGARPPAVHDDRPEARVKLDLRGPTRPIKAGEIFDVGLYVINPAEKRMDRLRVYLQFDPKLLQVVDYDTGNVVTRGINIHDADALEQFPFDYFRYNYADNTKGNIVYEVSASSNNVRGAGRLATIRMKALQETPRAELVMVQNAEGLSPTTAVSFLGESLMPGDAAPARAQAVQGIAMEVRGRAVAVRDAASEADVYNPFMSNLARKMQQAGE